MKRFSWRRALAIFSKEFKHIMRDPFTLIMALLLPLTIVLILGNSIEFNIKSIHLAWVDNDRTESSRRLIDTFGSSDYFKTYPLDNPGDIHGDIVTDRARAAIVVPPDFEKNVLGGGVAPVQVLVDGADNSAIMAIMNYLTIINRSAYFKIHDIPQSMSRQNPAMRVRYLFNPELNSRWFSVPGLSAVIIALVAIMLTTLTICREWEQGSMEMLLSTPATSLEIILGKTLPYAILSFLGFVLVFIVARVVFGVPFVGNYLTLILGTLLFILGYLAMGLYISISTHNQQVAIQYACVIGLLPTVILSGFVFPVEYMGRAYQYISAVFPARFYIDITRDQFLKGSSIAYLWSSFAALAGIAAVLLTACLLRFKRTLE
ncbi:MAG: ABC transporter permease [Alphaproteobacteria bacterium]|nr:ABC transporter permease [Alphaproteobacteria bacterium]